MNTNLRAIAFGSLVALGVTVALDNVGAAEPVQVVHLDAVQVTAHKANFDADGNLMVVRLDPVLVVAHKDAE